MEKEKGESMSEKYSLNWDLDVFFPGGSDSPEFQRFMENLEEDVDGFHRRIRQLEGTSATDVRSLEEILNTLQDLIARLDESGSFIECLTSQNTKDEQAKIYRARLSQVGAAFNSAMTRLDRLFLQMSDSEWASFLQSPRNRPDRFLLEGAAAVGGGKTASGDGKSGGRSLRRWI